MIEYIHDKRLNSATLRIDVNISISVSVLVYYRCTASCCQQQQVAACAVQSVTLLRVLYWAVLSQSVLQGSSHTLIYPPAPIRIQSTEHFYKPPVVMLIAILSFLSVTRLREEHRMWLGKWSNSQTLFRFSE